MQTCSLPRTRVKQTTVSRCRATRSALGKGRVTRIIIAIPGEDISAGIVGGQSTANQRVQARELAARTLGWNSGAASGEDEAQGDVDRPRIHDYIGEKIN